MATKLILLSSHAPPVEVRCDGCKFWGDYDREHGRRFCRRFAPEHTSDGPPAERTDPAALSQESCLLTRADFGCAAFEVKE